MDRRDRPRPRWDELPEPLRTEIERLLGTTIVDAESRVGGWSPGSADRLLLADGRRAFVKAVSGEVNAVAVGLHRREAEVLRLLAGRGASPALIGEVEHEAWFALVTEDVGGRHPDPAADAEVAAVLDAVAALPRADGPARALLPSAADDLAEAAHGWGRLLADGLDGAVPLEMRSAIPALDRLASGWADAVAGDTVAHLDLRFDNALLDERGRGRLVDWPSAAVGADWLDAVTIVLEVRRLAGRAAAERAMSHAVLRDVDPGAVDVFLAVLGGYFFDSARLPPSPGVEGVRAFQRVQGEQVVAWLLERRPELTRG